MEPTNQEAVYEQSGEVNQAVEEQAAPMAPELAPAADPEDLAAAFAALRENDKKPAQTSVAAGEAEQQQPAEQQPAVPVEQYGQSGNDANVSQRIDWNAKRNEAINSVRQLAINQVRKQWQEQGRRTLTIDELARRDEQTGEIYYVNLDDDPQSWNKPGYRGVSRSVARQRMKEFNEDLQVSWANEVNQATNSLMQAIAPYQKMVEFGPIYDKMPSDVQNIMDRLTAPYAIVGSDGTIAGYNVDLYATAQQAIEIAKMYRSQAPVEEQPKAGAVRTPALDAGRAAGGQRQTATKEPENIGDAIAMFERMQKEQRKANKK